MQLFSPPIWRNAISRFGYPILLAFIVLEGLHHASPLSPLNEALVKTLPYILLPVAVFLGELFNQSRTSLAAILLLCSYHIIQTWLQSPLSIPSTKLAYTLLAVALPLNLLWIHRLPERRLVTRSNIYFLVAALLQFIAATFLVNYLANFDLTLIWQHYLVSFPLISKLPVAIILLFVASLTLHSMLVLKRNQPHDHALFIGTLFSALTFTFFQYNMISSVAYSVSSLLLLTNLISCSHELAYIDQLTGIPGRRSLDTELKHLGRTYSIAMIDIDHFKMFNDTYGHNTGDDVLRLVASILAKQSNNAKVYRYGGEEFTIIFKGRTQEASLRFLEQVRKQVESYPLNVLDHPTSDSSDDSQKLYTHITVSIGVSDNHKMDSPYSVLKAADLALYRAKSNGRNQVCQRLHI
ncbi:GGDEF domain-containing protein (plasmid) [Photobacterium sp. DA100]|uniref:GGDEF domain-containing protein n=1 Tax=Photobacterium sp. DA100 TaxID=3027472 RepID=UPI0024784005|nr:GGDEF domain-containing protein [Photobacterium sp. DA100]WEM44413.1 GGDEF domain-containing protein [Photobacterium sp. DA100]